MERNEITSSFLCAIFFVTSKSTWVSSVYTLEVVAFKQLGFPSVSGKSCTFAIHFTIFSHIGAVKTDYYVLWTWIAPQRGEDIDNTRLKFVFVWKLLRLKTVLHIVLSKMWLLLLDTKSWIQMNVIEKREGSIWIWFNNFLTSIFFIYDNKAYLNT